MEVSNTTDTDTQYRTRSGSGTPMKEPEVLLIKAGEVKVISNPPCCPFTVEFAVGGKIVSTQTCDEPVRRITLFWTGPRTGPRYQVRRFKLQKPPQPTRRRSAGRRRSAEAGVARVG